MSKGPGTHLAIIVQRFVNGWIDAPELFAETQTLLGPGTDAAEIILAELAQGAVHLQLPPGRATLIQRFEQYANGEVSYSELELWFFALAQVEEIATQSPSDDPEVELLRKVVEWGQLWEDEKGRPVERQFFGLAAILREYVDPIACLETLETALSGDRPK